MERERKRNEERPRIRDEGVIVSVANRNLTNKNAIVTIKRGCRYQRITICDLYLCPIQCIEYPLCTMCTLCLWL